MAGDIRFSEIRRLLESNGWQLARIHGSHHIFKKAGRLDLSIPVHQNRVKRGYVRLVEKTIARESD